MHVGLGTYAYASNVQNTFMHIPYTQFAFTIYEIPILQKLKMDLNELNLNCNESLLFRKLDVLLNLMLTKTQKTYSLIQIKLQVKSGYI